MEDGILLLLDLPAEDLAEATEPVAESTDGGAPKDARRMKRLSTDKPLKVFPSSDPSAGHVAAQLVDIASFGIGFLQNKPMKEGERFVVRMGLPSHEVPLVFRVAHCRRLEGMGFRIGAELVSISNN